MKTLTTLIFAATTAFVVNANADTGNEVWSVEYEEYVNPADFNLTTQNSVASQGGSILWSKFNQIIIWPSYHHPMLPVLVYLSYCL